MKRFFLYLVAGLLLYSCYPRENLVTFYLENEMAKELRLTATLDDVATTDIFEEQYLDLLESPSFRKYIRTMVDVEVEKLEIKIKEYDDGVRNSIIELGNAFELSNINLQDGVLKIDDPEVLSEISKELLEHQRIPFTFRGQSIAEDSFEISVVLQIKGIFTD